MRRLVLLLPLALLACSDDDGPAVPRERRATFGAVTAIRIRTLAGAVQVRRGPPSVLLRAQGGDVDREVLVDDADGVLVIRNTSGDETWPLRIEVTVPDGPVGLDVLSRSAPIDVEGGEWLLVRAQTLSGAIRVDAAGIAGGALRTASAPIELVAREVAPTDDLECRSDGGDVSVVLPATFRGAVQASAASENLLDVPGHPKLRRLADSTGTNLRGWFGKPYTEQDVENAGAMWKQPPSVWARAKTGQASIRFAD